MLVVVVLLWVVVGRSTKFENFTEVSMSLFRKILSPEITDGQIAEYEFRKRILTGTLSPTLSVRHSNGDSPVRCSYCGSDTVDLYRVTFQHLYYRECSGCGAPV